MTKLILVALWPVWAAIVAATLLGLFEAWLQHKKIRQTGFTRRQRADLHKWDFEVALDQAIRLANGTDV